MNKYTITDFKKEFPNDAVCLDKLFQTRYGNLECCPSCGVVGAEFKRITTRRAYQCRECYFQIYPTAGTIFEKTTTPLNYWFYAMYLMTISRNGVSAKEIQRALGITYKTAWRMAKCIRELMANKKRNTPLTGAVEMDETYIGGKTEGQGRSLGSKTPVFGMIERNGDVIAQKVDDTKHNTLLPLIFDNVDKSAKVYTDEYGSYNLLDFYGYDHKAIRHRMKRYRVNDITTNSIEGFWSQLKRSIGGSYIHVSDKYLQHYVDEAVFRHNNRKNPGDMFSIMVGQV